MSDIMGVTSGDRLAMEEEQNRSLINAEENPFDSPHYNNIQTPDTPIQYGGGMTEMLLSDADVPAIIKRKYWWVFNKDNVLTFLDEQRKRNKMMAFDVAIINSMNAMESYDDYTFETELQFGIIRNALDVKLDRAVGFKGSNMKNERIVLQSQFSEARQIHEQGEDHQIREGFFKKLIGRRG